MAGLAGGDPFDFGVDSDGDVFCDDPFYCDGGGGSEGEELVDGPFVLDDSDGEFCVSGFAFLDGGDEDILAVEDRDSRSSHEGPVPETLGRSFDSDGGLGMSIPQLMSALDLAGDTSEEEEAGGGERGGGGFMLSGFGVERRPIVVEAADDDRDDGLGLLLSGFTLDSRPVTGGFQTLVDADEGGEEATGDYDMDEGGGLTLSGFDIRPPPVAGAFRMLVEDTDSDDVDLPDVLAGHVGEAWAESRRLPASRVAVEDLPEVELSEEEASHVCAVCKDGIAAGERVVRLPCKHFFHGECIRPWLAIRNTCPVCRYELPTGNVEYDRRWSTTGDASMAQQSTPAQSRGAGSGETMGAEDATGCSAGD